MKGFAYVLEAMIAALLILSVLVSVYPFQKQQESFDAITIKEKGYFCMKDLDNRGLLRYYALSNNTNSIRTYIQNCLPRSMNFSVNFCPSCTPDIPGNKTIVSINYLIAGEAATFQPINANLFLWSIL